MEEYDDEYDDDETVMMYDGEGDEHISHTPLSHTHSVRAAPSVPSVPLISSASLPNFKCYSCKKKFVLPNDQKIIRCSYCGYRILLKVRTRNHITYKTE